MKRDKSDSLALAMRRSAASYRRGLACTALLLAAPVTVAFAQDSSAQSGDLEEILVTGFRQSLESAATAKRESTNFTDSVFAEDIGKFPDLNIAESLNRIPGIQLTREVNGEGLNIAIRGLGTNFTKVVLNGTQIAVASSGRADAQNQNREIDLDLFPTELFTRLDVNKTPMASIVEGGVSGVVNMRSARPFDNPGTNINYQFQGGYGEISEEFSPRAALTASWTNDTFGVLVGVAGVRNKSTTKGFETIGWTNPGLTWDQCGVAPPDGQAPNSTASGDCNATGGGNWRIPDAVPVGAGNGLEEGRALDAAYLQQLNPGLSIQQISDALIPRLARPAYLDGTRERYSALVSLEYRPTETMNFYLDALYADANREFDRLDVNLVGRNGNMIPIGMQVDDNNVVTNATFANAQFFLEARPYDEEVDFYNINPGAHFQVTDWLGIDAQLNKSRSVFFREAPTLLFNTPFTTVQYSNTGGNTPKITSNLNLNDPDIGWTWTGGRLNIQNERRVTETEGMHVDFTIGDSRTNVKFGAAYDKLSRDISARDNSARWEDVACRNGLDANGDSPPAEERLPCTGLHPNSAVPQSALASYLMPGPYGFITADFGRFFADTNYYELSRTAPESNSSATGASTGGVIEKNWGGYVELNGRGEFMTREFRINAGVRYVTTDQEIYGPVTIGGVRQDQSLFSKYKEYLPSLNVSVDVTDDIVARFSGSRTLTRPNPSVMLPNTNFSDPAAQTATQGNPNLSPFLATNFDLGAEWYTGDEGYVALTLFQKEITGFTVNGINRIPFTQLGIPFDDLSPTQQNAIMQRGGPNVAQVDVQQQVNANGVLNLRGYEAQWQQPLSFVWDGLGFTANYTRILQRGDGEGAPAIATGVSPHLYNATVYWENYGASIRVSWTKTEDHIVTGFNQNGIPDAALYAVGRDQIDLSASYEFSNLPTSPMLTLNVINLTSEPERTYFQFPNATATFYDPGYQVLVGVRGRF